MVRLLVTTVLCATAFAAPACEVPGPVLQDARVLEQRRPTIEWQAAPDATAYRIRVESRIPNGRALAVHDSIASSPSFLPPQPLAEHRAKVRVRVRSLCAGAESAERLAEFMIDTSNACALRELELATRAPRHELRWKGGPAAAYQVSAYSLAGELLWSRETRETVLTFAPPAVDIVVAARALCAEGAGEARYRLVPAD